MTSEIQQNRYDQLVRRVAGLIGPGSKVSEVITELFPMIDVENLPPELFLLSGTRLVVGAEDVAAAGGLNARLGVFNPADSSTLITVTSATFSISTVGVVQWGQQGGTLLNQSLNLVFRDTRLPLVDRGVGDLRFDGTVALAPPNEGRVRMLANSPFTISDPNGLAVIAPGFGWVIGALTTGISFTGTIYWKERTAEPSELGF